MNEVELADADLVLSQDMDTYIKIRYFIGDIPTLIEAGEIEASDDQALTL